MCSPEAIVVGAGPAGLAGAAMLGRAKIDTLVLEQATGLGASWRGHYDRLHLHTTRLLSGLPGYRIPRQYGRWVSRDGVAEYLNRYAEHHGLEIRFETMVNRIDRSDDLWELETSGGPFHAPNVVAATGYNRRPFLPPWPGRDDFAGDLIHSSEYRKAAPYRGRDVLVVGTGNTGAEIATDLTEGGARRVRLSVRTPPQIFPRQALGIPAQAIGIAVRHLPPSLGDPILAAIQRVLVGDLSKHGMPRRVSGAYTQFLQSDVVPILDVGLIGALKQGRVEVVAAVQGFEGPDVLLADGTHIKPDAVIVATGYRRGLEPLVGDLGVLEANGRPAVHGAKSHPSAPGLYFIGYTNPISGNLRELGIDARKIARAVSRRRGGG